MPDKDVLTLGKSLRKSKRTREKTVYINKDGVSFSPGDYVQLKPKTLKLFHRTDGDLFAGREIVKSQIVYLFPDIKGFVRVLKKLGGYWTWDVNDLEKV